MVKPDTVSDRLQDMACVYKARNMGNFLDGGLIDVSSHHYVSALAPRFLACAKLILISQLNTFARSVCKSVSDAADKPYSYIVVATKALPELVRTSDILRPLLARAYVDKHPQPTYVLMQNGLNVEAELYEAIKELRKGEPKIISTALWIGTNLFDGNVVKHNEFVRLRVYAYSSV
jgi:hypothetical protein